MAMASGQVVAFKRPSHLDLRPLAMDHSTIQRNVRGASHLAPTSVSFGPSSSVRSLESPSLVFVPYPHDNNPLAAPKSALPQPHGSHQSPQLPRRHSVLSTNGLIGRMDNFRIHSPRNTPPGRMRERQSFAEEHRNLLLYGVQRGDLARLGSVVSRKNSSPGSNPLLRTLESSFPDSTRQRLREWGPAYVGKDATADVFVRAIHFQSLAERTFMAEERSSTVQIMPEGKKRPSNRDGNLPIKAEIVVRARVFPCAKERKPFIIQRRFNLEEMRGNVAGERVAAKTATSTAGIGNMASHARHLETRSLQTGSYSMASPQAVNVSTDLNTDAASRACFPAKYLASIGRRTLPIHVEYALNYLPVLAALIFSGHIRKGDTIDLPLPNPGAWGAVVLYIYTGQGVLTSAMRENILYLAGRLDE